MAFYANAAVNRNLLQPPDFPYPSFLLNSGRCVREQDVACHLVEAPSAQQSRASLFLDGETWEGSGSL